MGLSMFLPGHWSHIFVGCFIEEIAEEKEPLAPRTKYCHFWGVSHQSKRPLSLLRSALRARANPSITN